jgi:hypothetical protein
MPLLFSTAVRLAVAASGGLPRLKTGSPLSHATPRRRPAYLVCVTIDQIHEVDGRIVIEARSGRDRAACAAVIGHVRAIR